MWLKVPFEKDDPDLVRTLQLKNLLLTYCVKNFQLLKWKLKVAYMIKNGAKNYFTSLFIADYN